MSKTKDTGGSAFPQPHSVYSGMTLRDYFAAALQGYLASVGPHTEPAAWAYRQADAMLEARK